MLINYTKYYAPCTLYILCVSGVCIVEVERFLEQAREKPSQKALYLINQDSQALFVLLYTLYINRIHCDILESPNPAYICLQNEVGMQRFVLVRAECNETSTNWEVFSRRAGAKITALLSLHHSSFYILLCFQKLTAI